MRSSRRGGLAAPAAAAVLVLTLATTCAEETPAGKEAMSMQPSPAREADFQPYIFWAYGLACALLSLFMLWTLVETRRTRARLAYLEERLERASAKGGATPP